MSLKIHLFHSFIPIPFHLLDGFIQKWLGNGYPFQNSNIHLALGIGIAEVGCPCAPISILFLHCNLQYTF